MTVFLALQLLYDVCLLGACGYALARGGSDERIAASLILLASAATAILIAWPGFAWRRDHWQIMLVDLALLLGFGWLASFSERFWPLWATAFQLIDVATHGVMLIAPERLRPAYVISQAFWAYPILAAIVVGTRRRRLRRARDGGGDPDRDAGEAGSASPCRPPDP